MKHGVCLEKFTNHKSAGGKVFTKAMHLLDHAPVGQDIEYNQKIPSNPFLIIIPTQNKYSSDLFHHQLV